tara:strand:+ start:857 stop:1297 length:441 start_codon:yes stop_codon:yes gene_type:complete
VSSHIIENQQDIDGLMRLISNRDLPITVNIKKGKDRTIEQNKLQRMWLLEAQEQGDMTAEEYRGWCKLHLGCQILYYENEVFAEAFDAVIRPLSYENKLKAMMMPLDMPVTRIMTTKQNKQYLDDVYQHFTGLGMKLTDPDDQGRE